MKISLNSTLLCIMITKLHRLIDSFSIIATYRSLIRSQDSYLGTCALRSHIRLLVSESLVRVAPG